MNSVKTDLVGTKVEVFEDGIGYSAIVRGIHTFGGGAFTLILQKTEDGQLTEVNIDQVKVITDPPVTANRRKRAAYEPEQ